MEERSAVIFLTDDREKTGLSQPLFLSPAAGVPLLAWLTEALCAKGVERFFLLCQAEFLEAAKTCFPAGSQLTTCAEEDPSDFLHVFLSTTPLEEQTVYLITGPAAYFPASRPNAEPEAHRSPVSRVSRRLLMEALDDNGTLSRLLQTQREILTGHEGFYPVTSPVTLAVLGKQMNRDRLLRLAAAGVQIWDLGSCYTDPRARISSGTELLPGTIVRGKTTIGTGCVIGPNSLIENSSIGAGARVNASQVYGSAIGENCQVGPFAHIRPDTHMEKDGKAGAFVELKNTNLGQGTKVPHLSYLGDSDVGPGVNIGCGTATANYDRVQKSRTTIEAGSFVGCHTCLVAPVSLGEGAYVAAGSVITQDVPKEALALARSRQTNKKDWAAKHKK